MAKFLVISEYQDPPSRPSYLTVSLNLEQSCFLLIISSIIFYDRLIRNCSLERFSDLSTVLTLNAVTFGLVLFIGKVLRPFHCVHLKYAVTFGLVLFILHLNWLSLTSKKISIQETSPNSLYKIQYAAIQDSSPTSRTTDPFSVCNTFPVRCLYPLHILFKVM